MDSYGCTLFHSINLFKSFNVKSLRPEILEVRKTNKKSIFNLLHRNNILYLNNIMFYRNV